MKLKKYFDLFTGEPVVMILQIVEIVIPIGKRVVI